MFGLHAMNHETVKDIKLLIQAKEDILPEQYSLFHDGKLLEDNRTLASLNYQLGTLLYLVFNPIDVMSISVKMPSGKILKPEVKVLHTIHDVKAIIWSMVGFEDGAEDLTYAGKLLEDSKTLAACNIKEDSLLEMLIWTFKIFVKDLTGKTLVYKVCKEDRVLDVKNKISDKQGGPVSNSCLIFAGYKMEDDRDLASYNVQTGSILREYLDMFVLFWWTLGKVLIRLYAVELALVFCRVSGLTTTTIYTKLHFRYAGFESWVGGWILCFKLFFSCSLALSTNILDPITSWVHECYDKRRY
ncbi:hypothetical protein Vadar_032303 [Vaccinium darrowii]|uniref:Uncharacterized protein n=1 Tax=Vaccinium darrowii TaxID=229202 RepID=A0ACB7Z019_9ERIC|nr:hypothetical protein Vadar_032303 [Vaccinium darrowii]